MNLFRGYEAGFLYLNMYQLFEINSLKIRMQLIFCLFYPFPSGGDRFHRQGVN